MFPKLSCDLDDHRIRKDGWSVFAMQHIGRSRPGRCHHVDSLQQIPPSARRTSGAQLEHGFGLQVPCFLDGVLGCYKKHQEE